MFCSKNLQGDDILVMVPHELNETLDKQIIENNTYCFQNFQVLKNDDQFKLSENQFKLRFNGSTRISDVNIHQISDPIPKWKDFVEILSGKWHEDVLYGTIYNLYILLFLIYNIFVTAYCTYI
jgi:hypothetical protein